MLHTTEKSVSGAHGNPVMLTRAEKTWLFRLASNMPQQDWTNPELCKDVQNYVRDVFSINPEPLRRTFSTISNQYHIGGYSRVSLGDFNEWHGDEITRRSLAILGACTGNPFGAFYERGFWQTLGVNEDAKELRAESSGYIPFHIDFDQATKPPHGVMLYCKRPDALGGGENIVCKFGEVLKSIDAHTLQRMLDTKISYSHLYNAYNIGEEFNPHPLMQAATHEEGIFRYNGKARPNVDAQTQDLFDKLEPAFLAASEQFMLKQGDLVILNQRKVLHGRQPLNGTRDTRDALKGDGRLLWQAYIS